MKPAKKAQRKLETRLKDWQETMNRGSRTTSGKPQKYHMPGSRKTAS